MASSHGVPVTYDNTPVTEPFASPTEYTGVQDPTKWRATSWYHSNPPYRNIRTQNWRGYGDYGSGVNPNYPSVNRRLIPVNNEGSMYSALTARNITAESPAAIAISDYAIPTNTIYTGS